MDTGPLADVAQPLQEAADYERLATERRRGALGLLLAVPMLAVLAWWLAGGFASLGPVIVGLPLAILAYVLLIYLVLRRLPAWKPLIVEPQTRVAWVWRLAFFGYMFGTTWLPAFLSFRSEWSEPVKNAVIALHLAVLLGLGQQQAARLAPARGLWAWALIAAPILLSGLTPDAWGLPLLIGILVVGFIARSLFRLWAPRRWLVR